MKPDDISSDERYEMIDALRIIGVSNKIGTGKDTVSVNSSGYHALIILRAQPSGADIFGISRADVIFVPPYRQYASLIGDEGECVHITFDGREAHEISSRYGFRKFVASFEGIRIRCEDISRLSELTGQALALCAKGILYMIFSEIATREEGKSLPLKADSAAEKVKAYIDEFFSSSTLSLNTIAAALSYHPNYISKVFNEAYGMSIKKYVNVLRVYRAKFLMEEGENSLKVISAECGFTDAEYFSSVFRTYLGQNPKDYLKRIRSIGTTPD